MQIIRRSSFVATPWKNGGGITHEVIRVPYTPPGNVPEASAAAAAFLWRVSVAQIDVPGPFSNFAGYDRRMVLLKGHGVRLTFDGREPAELTRAGDMAEFDGAHATHCELIDGPCTDLNLMVSTSIKGTRAWVERFERSRTLSTNHGKLLMFPISGAILLDAGGESERLGPWDFAVLSASERVAARSVAHGAGQAAPGESTAPLVFFAALDDNSL